MHIKINLIWKSSRLGIAMKIIPGEHRDTYIWYLDVQPSVKPETTSLRAAVTYKTYKDSK
jgi:hypothetical protein